jgi:hypothetical protein
MDSERRSNDELILFKLQNLDEKFDAKFDAMDRKFVAHLLDDKEQHVKLDHAIHGNGAIGMKAMIEVIKSRVAILSLFLVGAWSAIISSFFKGN